MTSDCLYATIQNDIITDVKIQVWNGEIMFCMNCGKQIQDGSKFCYACGAPQNGAPQLIQQLQNQAVKPTETQVQQPVAEPAEPLAYTVPEEKPRGFSSKKLIIIILVVVGLLAAGLAVFALTDVFGEDGPSLELAQRYLSEEKYEQAIIEFERLLEIDPKDPDLYLGLAEAYEASGNSEKARKTLENALEELGEDELDDIREMVEELAPTETTEIVGATAEATEQTTTTAATTTSATTTTTAATTTTPAEVASLKYEDFIGSHWRSDKVTLGGETSDTYRVLNFYEGYVIYSGGMFEMYGQFVRAEGNVLVLDLGGSECTLTCNEAMDQILMVREINGQTEMQVFDRDGVIPGIEAPTTTASTTTTFNDDQTVSDAVDVVDVTELDNPHLEVNERIEWMAWWDMDETTPAAMLFKDVYGVPSHGKDPERDGRIFDYTYIAYATRYDSLAAAIASGDSPDFFPFENLDYPYGVMKGRYQPVDDIINIDSPKWDIAREAMEQFEIDGRVYCAFYEIGMNNLLYYRRSVIGEAGLDDPLELFNRNQWTWNEFIDMGRAFRNSGDGKYLIDGYNAENSMILSTGMPMIGLDDGNLVSNLYSPVIERVEADLISLLQRENLRYPRHELNGWSVNPKAWANGDVLFYADGGTWVYEDTLSKFADRFAWAEDEIVCVPFPKDPQADAYYFEARHDALMWVKGSDNAEGVAAWLDCCVTTYQDPAVREAVKYRTKDNYGWSDENLDNIYAWTDLRNSPLTPIFDFKHGLGAVSDASAVENPIQSLTNVVYMTGDSTYTQLREAHNPAIQAAIDELNEYIDSL